MILPAGGVSIFAGAALGPVAAAITAGGGDAVGLLDTSLKSVFRSNSISISRSEPSTCFPECV